MAPSQRIKQEFDDCSVNEDAHTHQGQNISAPNMATVPDDSSDVTMTDGLVDGGHQIGQENKRSNRTAPISDQTPLILGSSVVLNDDPHGGLQTLGRGVKQLIQAVQALRHLGVENHLPLPRIVVVGDQSTGKSSLIEGISEIKVPRSAGVCTRCPLEINLTEQDTQWSCKVFLHKKYNYQGSTRSLGKNATRGEGATKARPLGPWAEQDGEDFPFACITSKADILDVLERAQLATLNPNRSYEIYKPGNPLPNRGHEAKFSPNIIRLDISGPGLPNLSFYDLPGVINVSEVPDEAYLVELVRNLVIKYIKDPDCINVLALTMTHDVANSSAFGLIRDMKAGPRTIGCLTKPDRIAAGEAFDQWAQILGGQAFELGFGYHVIKNNQNPAVDHATARKEEAAFFGTQEPWATELHTYNDRFGTLRLQTALSQRLTTQIRTRLPVIIEQIQSKAESINAQLKELPAPLHDNLALTVMEELMTFQNYIEKAIDGGAAEYPFQKDWDLLIRKFRQDLAETHPVVLFPFCRTPGHDQQFAGSAPKTSARAVRKATPIPIESEDSDEIPATTPSKPSPTRRHSSKRPPPSTSKPSPAKFMKTMSGASVVTPIRVGSKRFRLTEVRAICQSTCRGRIRKVTPEAIENMIGISIEHWEDLLDRFMTRTKQLCEDTVFKQIQKVYGKYMDTAYYETIRQICETFFNNAFSEQRQIAKRILQWEQCRPGSCNDKAVEEATAEALVVLRKKSREVRAEAYLSEQERKSGKLCTGQGRTEKLDKVTDAQLAPEGYTQEIEAMSSVKAYYECAYHRFVDTVSSSIQCEFFGKCRKDIVHEMKTVLALAEKGVEGRLALLLAANPIQEQRRIQLNKDLDTITKAQERLGNLAGNV